MGGAEPQTRGWLVSSEIGVWVTSVAPNRALLVTQQLVSCNIFFSFSCSVLIIFLLKAKSLHSVLAAFLSLPTLHFVHDKILLWKELR